MVAHEWKREIEELCRTASGHVPGSKGYFKKYQKVLSKYVATLTEDDRTQYEAMAKEWTERSPPATVQQKSASLVVTFDPNLQEARMAEKYTQQYVKEFSEQMWKQLGIRVFVLTAHKDTAGTIDVSE